MRQSFLISTVLFALIFILVGCGGGGSVTVIIESPSYAGAFEARYNLVIDECGLVAEGSSGFVDIHEISQTGRDIIISSEAGFVLGVSGTIDDRGGFTAREEYILEEPGFAPCVVESALSYENPDQELVHSAESVFVFRLSCDDGFTCESRAIGTAERLEAQADEAA